ncbi:SGNH/GDSL hydrolase family protein [Streptomyces rubiginosohelvolus]|uniref:SGNH/GDSL hydrolase family protein n=1 Tax=Streptomyces rubiginosohelvolus TaxID=67362 RepID=UPI0036F6031E
MPFPIRRSAPIASRHRPTTAAVAVASAAVLLAGTAATASAAPAPVRTDGGAPVRYVALGDSFSSGPGIPDQTDEACGRSSRNYPTLVAASLGAASFTDATCAGADTRHMTTPQGAANPQFDAPQARVLVVGYPAIVPDDGTSCRATVPLAEGDFAWFRDKQKQLNSVLASEAGNGRDTYVDAYAPSVGHDACKPQGVRWIEPEQTAEAAGFHPNAAGHRSMADATLATLTR